MDTANEERLLEPVAHPSGKEIFRDTTRLLTRGGTLSVMLGSLLFCLACSVLPYTLTQFAAALCNLLLPRWVPARLPTAALSVLGFLLFFFLVLPLWLGRLRLAGLLWKNSMPSMEQLFYYFTSRRLLGRAWRIGFLLLTETTVAVGIASLLYQLISLQTEPLLVFLFVLWSLLFALLLLFLFGFSLLAVGVAVGNESLRVRDAIGCSFSAARGHILSVSGFSLRSLPRLLLGIATVGVFQLLYFSHFYILSYMRLCMTLCPKEDDTP